MIKVIDLTKAYGDRIAVDRVNFSIEAGKIIGFLGPNGAGKTTTMRMLTGFIPSTDGKIHIGDYDLDTHPLEAKKLIGYLPENVPLYTDMTVLEYLGFMAEIRQVKKNRNACMETLEKVQLENRANSLIGSLSKGMRQRVGLAQAILHNPPVLILDEPTVGLDPAQISEIRKLIQSLGEQHTILLSTHILPEVQQVCDRVLIINKGKLVAEDTPEQLQKQLHGNLCVKVEIANLNQEIISTMEQLPDVLSARETAPNWLEITLQADTEIRPHIIRELVQNGAEILEFKHSVMDLEQIFLELTREELPAETN